MNGVPLVFICAAYAYLPMPHIHAMTGTSPLRVTVLSMHTSPLAQPGTGDGGGMNVYVRELSTALARAGVVCDVFTRSDREGLAPIVNIEPGLRVHHVEAGPVAVVAKEELLALTGAFAESVIERLATEQVRPTLIHANLRFVPAWLDGLLVTPRFHHWHHGIEKEAIDVNFSIHFPLFDRLFGTHYMPPGKWPDGYGIDGHPVPTGYWKQLLHPFV